MGTIYFIPHGIQLNGRKIFARSDQELFSQLRMNCHYSIDAEDRIEAYSLGNQLKRCGCTVSYFEPEWRKLKS